MFGLFKSNKKSCNNEIDEQAYEYALRVFSELGIIEAIATLHKICLQNLEDKAEIRGVVIGGFRTVGLGASLVARYMQERNVEENQKRQAYLHFINDSSIRQIANDFGSYALPDEQSYVNVMQTEATILLEQGYEMGNLFDNGQISEAFELWRSVMKMDLTLPQESVDDDILDLRMKALEEKIISARKGY